MKNKKLLAIYSATLLALTLTACTGGHGGVNPTLPATPGTPTDGATPPTDGTTPPTDGTNPPTDGTNPPTDGTAPPAGGNPDGNLDLNPPNDGATGGGAAAGDGAAAGADGGAAGGAAGTDGTAGTGGTGGTGGGDTTAAAGGETTTVANTETTTVTETPTMPAALTAPPSTDSFNGRVLQSNGTTHFFSDFDGRNADIFTVTIAGTNASVVLKEGNALSKRNVTELTDTDGSLLGFYGSVTTAAPPPDTTPSTPLQAIFYAMKTGSSRLPTENNATYTGTFHYALSGTSSSTLHEADASFTYNNRTLSGSITDKTPGANSWTVAGGNVLETGSFNAQLTSANTGTIKSGVLQGGFFGQQGQVLAAEAQSTGNGTGADWAGVVVAEKRPTASP